MPYKDSPKRHTYHREYSKEYNKTIWSRYARLRIKAKQRKIKFVISFDKYRRMIAKGLCTYCNEPLPIYGHGLDRVDVNKGYVTENTVPCCTSCNTIKGYLEKAGFNYPRSVELLKEALSLSFSVRN